jgi:hypothetical protein
MRARALLRTACGRSNHCLSLDSDEYLFLRMDGYTRAAVDAAVEWLAERGLVELRASGGVVRVHPTPAGYAEAGRTPPERAR